MPPVTEGLLYLLWVAGLWFIVLPLMTLVHELSHALAVLVLTDHEVTVRLGNSDKQLKRRWNRLQFCIGWATGFIGTFHYADEGVAPYRNLAIHLAGPLASLLLALLGWGITSLREIPLWLARAGNAMAIAACIQFLITILPMRYPRWLPGYGGKSSDGWRALHSLH
ncbi:MAG: hypothetical protein JW892_09325 [Anaerolineae bacterium]|nr:hypothetical protein [Anaerolineae bacterium]